VKAKSHICVVSDYNFLVKGLALYDSLLKHDDNIVVHYLCIDDRSFDKLQQHSCDSLFSYHYEILDDETLLNIKNTDREYYCYTLSSYFSRYMMQELGSDITYIDSDIYFYDKLSIILDEIGDKDIGVFRHRQYPLTFVNNNGFFNVGVVHFKKTKVGQTFLNWWSDAVLHRKYPELATCGDQKYLDVLINADPENVFIDGNIGHGAPWQWQLYDYSSYFEDGCIVWDGQKQKLIFSHFSNFDYDLSENAYTPALRHSPYTPQHLYTNIPQLKYIHDSYFEQLKQTYAKYNFAGDIT